MSLHVCDRITKSIETWEQVEVKSTWQTHNVVCRQITHDFLNFSFLVSQRTLYYIFGNHPQDHRVFQSVCTRGKKKQSQAQKETRASPSSGSPGREREHDTHPVFISISHQIRSRADKSTSRHHFLSLEEADTRWEPSTTGWRRRLE